MFNIKFLLMEQYKLHIKMHLHVHCTKDLKTCIPIRTGDKHVPHVTSLEDEWK